MDGPNPNDLLVSFTVLLILLAGIWLMVIRPFAGGAGVAVPFPFGRRLLRVLAVIVALLLLGAWLETLSGERGRDRERRLPVFVVYSKRTPAIAAHIRAAQAAGKPAILHRAFPTPQDRRPGACRGWRGPGSCDEYPFASTYEGGPGKASIAGVPLWEQRRQGGDLSGFYRAKRIRDGDAFVVVVK